jgi:hypothetical protein
VIDVANRASNSRSIVVEQSAGVRPGTGKLAMALEGRGFLKNLCCKEQTMQAARRKARCAALRLSRQRELVDQILAVEFHNCNKISTNSH